MKKRNTIIVTLVILIIILSGIGYYKFITDRHNGFDISIKNNTSKNITGLTITYKELAKDIELPQIAPGKTYKINVNPKGNFSENSMIIYYKDSGGYKQQNTLIGYFEKGYNGKVKVNINSQDKNGLIIMQIEEKVF